MHVLRPKRIDRKVVSWTNGMHRWSAIMSSEAAAPNMANAEEQGRLDELMNDVNFPMPGVDDLDLDFDYEFNAQDLPRFGVGTPAAPNEYLLDQQFGAVAALATQASSRN